MLPTHWTGSRPAPTEYRHGGRTTGDTMAARQEVQVARENLKACQDRIERLEFELAILNASQPVG